jgi:hypothetical protein
MRAKWLMAGLPLLQALFLPAQTVAPSNGPGRISGIVVTEYGTPVYKAHVSVHAPGNDFMAKPRPEFRRSVTTDENGRFQLAGLKLRSYSVAAEKEEDEYADMSFFIYRPPWPIEVSLTRAEPVAEVTLQLGPKAGAITVSAVDKITRKPVMACIRISPLVADSNTIRYLSTCPASRMLLPLEADVILRVSAEGYKDWFYPGTSEESQALPIRLQSEEQMSLDVELQPDAKDE